MPTIVIVLHIRIAQKLHRTHTHVSARQHKGRWNRKEILTLPNLAKMVFLDGPAGSAAGIGTYPSKQHQRSNSASDLKSVTSITYYISMCILLIWFRPLFDSIFNKTCLKISTCSQFISHFLFSCSKIPQKLLVFPLIEHKQRDPPLVGKMDPPCPLYPICSTYLP